jgi:hypothetical protein
MNREVHVRFWESPEVKVLRATRQTETSARQLGMSGLPLRATKLRRSRGSVWCQEETHALQQERVYLLRFKSESPMP